MGWEVNGRQAPPAARDEPDLKRKFGASYEDYRRAVPRWLPRRPDR